jgi:hypothetical protein
MSPEPKLPFARSMHDANLHEVCVLTPGQWQYIRENWESQARRIAELEQKLLDSQREVAAVFNAAVANRPQPETASVLPDEVQRVLNRLDSSDPDFDDCADAARLIVRLSAEVSGPEGFATWKDAAITERLRRVEAERTAPPPEADWKPSARFNRDAPTVKESLTVQPPTADRVDRLERALLHLSLYVAANGDDWVRKTACEYLRGIEPPTRESMGIKQPAVEPGEGQ